MISYDKSESSFTFNFPLFPKDPNIVPVYPVKANVTLRPVYISGEVSFWKRSLIRILDESLILSTFPIFNFCLTTLIEGSSFSGSLISLMTCP
jgi:hypothetical protein